jgi:hypothetical protein
MQLSKIKQIVGYLAMETIFPKIQKRKTTYIEHPNRQFGEEIIGRKIKILK